MASRKKSRSTSSKAGSKNRPGSAGGKKGRINDTRNATVMKSSARSTVSGPTHRAGSSETNSDALTLKFEAAQKLAADMPYNENKALEHGELSSQPQEGQTITPCRSVSDRQYANRNQSVR